MKNSFRAIAVALLALFCLFLPNHSEAEFNLDLMTSSAIQSASVNDSSSTTFTLVTGVSPYNTKIYYLLLNTLTADNLTVKCGTTTLIPATQLGATSGLSVNFYPVFLRCNGGSNVTITKGSAATNVTAVAIYTQGY